MMVEVGRAVTSQAQGVMEGHFEKYSGSKVGSDFRRH